jgi:hypothetical protein
MNAMDKIFVVLGCKRLIDDCRWQKDANPADPVIVDALRVKYPALFSKSARLSKRLLSLETIRIA